MPVSRTQAQKSTSSIKFTLKSAGADMTVPLVALGRNTSVQINEYKCPKKQVPVHHHSMRLVRPGKIV